MLELIRKHQYGIMVLVAVIVIFAFAWWGDFFGKGDPVRSSSQPFIEIGGKSYTRDQIDNLANGSRFAQLTLPEHNFLMGTYSKYDFYPGLDYAINTVALRTKAADFGIVVSPEEIDKRMLQMPEFQSPESRQETFQRYGFLGMGEEQMAEVIGDAILLEKLVALLSAGLSASEIGAAYDYAARHQTIFASVASMPEVAPESIDVTDKESKEEFEKRKAGLKTERQVAIRYVFFESPEQEVADREKAAAKEAAAKEAAENEPAEKEPTEKEPAEDAGEGTGPGPDAGGASPETVPGNEGDEGVGGQVGAAGVDPLEKPAAGVETNPELEKTPLVSQPAESESGKEPEAPAAEGPTEEELKKLVKDYNVLVDDFWNEFFLKGRFDSKVDFAKVAADPRYGVSVVETGTFSMAKPPEDLSDQWEVLRAAVAQSKDLPISDPIPAVGGKIGYYIFELTQVEEPREMSFDEARPELEKIIRAQKAKEATLAKIEAARAKLVEAMEAKKPFADAAQEAGFEVEELKPFSPSEPPMELPNIRELYPKLMQLAPGKVGEPIEVPGKLTLVHVSKRELWKRVDAENLKDEARKQSVSEQARSQLRNWFLKVRDGWDERPLWGGDEAPL